jgi:hypothetical protein
MSHWNKYERIIMIINILAFWPLTYTLLLGQFSLLLLLAFLQMFIAMKKTRLTKAGIWMFLLTIKPQTLLIPAMMTLNKRYWRMALPACISGVVLFIASWLLIGQKPWLGYIKSLQALGSFFDQFGVHPATEYTVRGVLTNILGNVQGNLINTISFILLLLGMLLSWFLWSRDIHPEAPRFALYFSFTLTLSVFLSLHLNPHDSLVLVLPAALFYDYLRQNNYPKKVLSILLLLSPVVFFIAGFTDFNLFGIFRLPVILIIIFLAWMVFYLKIEHQRKHTSGLPAIG